MTRTDETRLGLTALLLIFIAAKLFGAIDWPWWCVLLPLEIPLAIVLVCLLAIGVITFWEKQR